MNQEQEKVVPLRGAALLCPQPRSLLCVLQWGPVCVSTCIYVYIHMRIAVCGYICVYLCMSVFMGLCVCA